MNTARSGPASHRTIQTGGLFDFRLSDELLRRIDFAAWMAWALIQTFMPLDASALLYLLAAYFSGSMILRYREFLQPLATCWPMFLLPLLAFLSAIWAPSASEAVRKGMLLALTAVIGIYVARQLTARQIIFSIFAVNAAAAILSAMSPEVYNGGATGVFDQKNVLAFSMFLTVTSGVVLLLDRAVPLYFRVLALPVIPIAFWMMLQAQSATIVILSVPMSFGLAVQVLVWSNLRQIKHLRSLLVLFGIAVAAFAAMLLFGVFGFDALEALLGSVGKDSTLTGRTVLWAQAERLMEQHPWTGVGANGFWRPEVGEANSILRLFHYSAYTQFSFHNSYLENGVQFGYPGMFATAFLGVWCVYRGVRTWLMRQDLHNAYFMFLGLLIFVRSFTEIDLAGELAWAFILIYIAAARKNQPPRATAAAG